ncbi:cellulase family glycosylhydrolase [Stenotrophobium rhamnosiphilum]|uniref:Glycoside hydrolase family 5 domain-containing protein n=1 Tax=Stenotrophobium rhamnosiphilum TaxID=2029166 RepID=A0A2T5MIR5_9GAMM|nr:cellulase family glycosylhydrolase [Stenotrophobium rhamnosiphilum]PTU32454.1 hypothetical protein CJD38_07350 [Stenotrophobium rhamnosiphilum]
MEGKIFQAIAIGLLSSSAFCADLPTPSVSNSVGVNVTFTATGPSIEAFKTDMPMMAAAGIKFARMDFAWDLIEKRTEQGNIWYDWSAYENIVDSMIQNGIRPYFILHHSHPKYEICAVPSGTECSKLYSPQHTNSIAAFSNWAAAAVSHFDDPHRFPTNPRIIWEIWNEPNLATFWYPVAGSSKTPVEQYLELAVATCTAIRSVTPNATIVGPALSKLNFSATNPQSTQQVSIAGKTYMEKLLDPNSNLRSCLDAISVHPYRAGATTTGNPETVADDYITLREMMNTPVGTGTLPIISGEWGYYSAPLVSYGVTSMVQAALVVRQQLTNLANNIPISIWYNWKDNGIDPFDNEKNYGLVSAVTLNSNAPSLAKPSYTALKTMSTELAGYELQSRITLSNPLDYALLFKNASGRYRLVMWTRDIPHLTSPKPSGSPLTPTTSVGMLGTRTSLISILGIPPTVLLTESPQYIE